MGILYINRALHDRLKQWLSHLGSTRKHSLGDKFSDLLGYYGPLSPSSLRTAVRLACKRVQFDNTTCFQNSEEQQ